MSDDHADALQAMILGMKVIPDLNVPPGHILAGYPPEHPMKFKHGPEALNYQGMRSGRAYPPSPAYVVRDSKGLAARSRAAKLADAKIAADWDQYQNAFFPSIHFNCGFDLSRYFADQSERLEGLPKIRTAETYKKTLRLLAQINTLIVVIGFLDRILAYP